MIEMNGDRPELKRCIVCWTEKPATAEFFAVDKRNPNGLDGRCKPCRADVERTSHERQRLDKLSSKLRKQGEMQLKVSELMLMNPAFSASNRQLLDEILVRWGGLPGLASDLHVLYVNCEDRPAQRTRILELIVRMIHQEEKMNGPKDPERMSDEEIDAEREALLKYLFESIRAEK